MSLTAINGQRFENSNNYAGRGDESPVPNRPQTQNLTELNQAQEGVSKIRAINIQQLDRGYIVQVGCQTLAIASKEELLAKLYDYINSPAETERRYNLQQLF